MAELLFLENKHAEAIEVLIPLADRAANAPPYFNLLGMCYTGLNHFPHAARALIKAITLDPAHSDYYFTLAGIYQKAGDNEGAIQSIEKGVGP